jgi:hypothetical protein
MEEGADRSSIGVGDDEHPRTMARHDLAGKRIAAQDFMDGEGRCDGRRVSGGFPPCVESAGRAKARYALSQGVSGGDDLPTAARGQGAQPRSGMDLHRRAANNLEEAKAPPKTGMSLRRLSSRFSRPSG